MPKLCTRSFLFISVLFISILQPLCLFAQKNKKPDSLKNISPPKQEVREVKMGTFVHELPQGLAITAFASGGEKEKFLDSFIQEQKVAGLIIL